MNVLGSRNPLLQCLQHVVPEREEYDEVWIHVKGYDFVPVEEYMVFVSKFIKSLNLKYELWVLLLLFSYVTWISNIASCHGYGHGHGQHI